MQRSSPEETMQTKPVVGSPLSPQQRRLFSLEPDGAVQSFRAQVAVLLEGPLDPAALRRALERLVARHEILRTSFRRTVLSAPLQVIEPTGTLVLIGRELAGPEEHALEALWRELEEERFDAESEPRLSARFTALAPERHCLVLGLPALCADRAGLYNLVRELAGSTEFGGEGHCEEPLQYADLAGWQNSFLEEEEALPGRDFWRRAFHEDTAPPWIAVRPVCAGQTRRIGLFTGDTAGNGEERLLRVRQIAEEIGVTVPAFLLAAWQVLLARIVGEREIVVATAFEGRGYAELEGAMGLLERYLPVRGRLEEGLRLRDLAVHLDTLLRDAGRWQECFSWDLLPACGDTGGPCAPPFGFAFRSEIAGGFTVGDLSFTVRRAEARLERFEAEFWCEESGEDRLSFFLDHDTERLLPGDANRLAARFEVLLGSACGAPDLPCDRLDLLTASERRQLVSGLGAVATLYPQGRLVHDLFREQAERSPDAVALAFEGRSLTYAEIDARSDQLAALFHRSGARPDVPVAICVEHGVGRIAGLLGALKAGAPYAALDPAQPPGRLAAMLEDVDAPVLLVEERFVGALPGYRGAVVALDADGNVEEDPAAGSRPPTSVAPENLAYILFTSGSTGRPKGVMVEHRQLLNYVYAVLDRLDLPAGSSYATVSTFAADLGNTCIFASLCTGGCLHVVSRERAADPQALAEYLERHPVDCLKIVPGHLQALLAAERPGSLLPRRRLVLGGEALDRKLVERVAALAPDCLVLNHYGPTEATVGVTTFTPAREAADSRARVPLGRPLANVRAHLLDPGGELVPLGTRGELCIGGAAVTRGYLKGPTATAERFIPDPFSPAPGERLYRTGDLARWLPGGALEFLGRVDSQVKLRGFRVELGEIEAVLAEHPAISGAVVLVRESAASVRSLVAYVAASRQSVSPSGLRDYLEERLPDFMIPAGFVFLDRLPLSANGKVDRARLPASGGEDERAAPYVPPGHPDEELLAGIWADVLGLERVGIHDNFFALGGDSILSIQVVARSSAAGLKLTPRQMFEHQTVAELVAVAGAATAGAAPGQEDGGEQGPVPLTPIQWRFFAEERRRPHHYNQSLLLEIGKPLDPAALEQVFRTLEERHDALRLRFCRTEGAWAQTLAEPGGTPVFSHADLSCLPLAAESRAIERAAAEVQAGFDLAAGPLLRAVLFDLAPERPCRLLLAAHHLVVDGVSWRILLAELEELYGKLDRGEPVILPPRTASFRRWAQLLAEHGRSEGLEGEGAFWLQEARDRNAITSRLPVDFPGSGNPQGSARSIQVSLSIEETETLLRDVPKAAPVRIEDLLLTALAQTLLQWTGGKAVLVDLEGHGREPLDGIDLTRTVGWLTAVYPVVFGAEAAGEAGEALKAVKEQLRRVPDQGWGRLGYGVLRYLSGDGAAAALLAEQPQAEVIFNYLGQLDRVLGAASPFSQAAESRGREQDADDPRRYLLEVTARVAGGRFATTWTYGENLYRHATVEALAQRFIAALRTLVSHCLDAGTQAYVPADFPLARLDQAQLATILSQVGRRSGGGQ